MAASLKRGAPVTLRPAFELRLRAGRAYIVRQADGQPISALGPSEAVFVSLLDGRRTLEEVERSFCAAFGEGMRDAVRYTGERVAPLLHVGPASRHAYPVSELAAVTPADPAEGIRLLPGPRVLHWHVTQYCPRRCAYCYAEPRHGTKAPDATLGLDRLRVLFSEAADLGATELLVSGAEPFLRRDLPEAISAAIASGLGILLTTKFPIDANIAERLAAGGLRHLSLSIDTLEAEENAILIGSRQYARQMRRVVANLRAAGLQFSIQCVVTPFNVDSVAAVARFAESEGARVLQLVPYKDVRQPIAALANAALRLHDTTVVDQLRNRLALDHPALQIERFVEATDNGGFHCDIGQTKLLILPDGVVHRCYKLTSDRSLRGLDLNQVSLARAWHDPGFVEAILPSPDAYGATICGTCGSKTRCDLSGRCIYDALVHHGRYAAPDRGCAGRAGLVRRAVIKLRAI